MLQNNSLSSSHIRTSRRRHGQHLGKEARAAAQETFLRAFRNTANVRASCLSAGIDRSLVQYWQEKDATFADLYTEAESEANDVIRGEIFRRAMQGIEKPIVSMGRIVLNEEGKPIMERVYSDNLLMFLAKSRMPEFREKQEIEHSGSIDVNGARETLLQRLQGIVNIQEIDPIKEITE